MNPFVKTPHLPRSPVRLCAIGAGWDYIANALEQRGIEVFQLPPHPGLPPPVSCHADMLLHHLGEGGVVLAEGMDRAAAAMVFSGFLVTTAPLQAEYPGDIALNCFVLKKYLFCEQENTAESLLNYYQLNGAEVVPIRQGYAKCSVCIVDEESAITADMGLAAAMEQRGIQVLRVCQGHIQLPGYPFGFIGGCAAKLDKNQLAFFGELSTHPDALIIRQFCLERGVAPVSLCAGPLTDIGGAIPLREESSIQNGMSEKI
ncbi:hypothetical protein LJC05_03215 [Bacteroides sp. OttesenSCG-928-J23]|nr:hypothetical protein [Bacteroides sp. OttesenSCG-928-J23]